MSGFLLGWIAIEEALQTQVSEKVNASNNQATPKEIVGFRLQITDFDRS